MSSHAHCKYIFGNLLKTLRCGNEQSTKSSIFVRELLVETPPCDTYASLLDVRIEYEERLRSLDAEPERDGGIVRRLKYCPSKLTADDNEAALITVYHYRDWTSNKLLASFSWSNWLEYQVCCGVRTMRKRYTKNDTDFRRVG